MFYLEGYSSGNESQPSKLTPVSQVLLTILHPHWVDHKPVCLP